MTSATYVAFSQILLLSGLALTIGLKSTMQFFIKPQNYKVYLSFVFLIPHLSSPCIQVLLFTVFVVVTQGTIAFGVGFFLVLIGWPIFGMILESYGFLVLFRFVIWKDL